jgi:hypothetical protein
VALSNQRSNRVELLTKADILDRREYEAVRDTFRRRVMVQKDRRRVKVGNHCTFHFENRDTMRYQVQEMLRAEDSWTRAGAIEDELAAYNPIIPQHGELSATMMLEYETPEERADVLPKFVGLDRHVHLQIGDAPAITAAFDRGQIDEHKVSSVQYLKFHLTGAQVDALAMPGTVVRLVIDHPVYRAQAVLSEETRQAIAEDPR